MNFLAHSYLSFGDTGLVAGNYLGDFIKNRDLVNLPVAIQNGVALHRDIDSFTDQNELFKAGTRLLHKEFRKYAPVVLDIYFDFLLSKFWRDFHPETLEVFCQRTYAQLRSVESQMPKFLQGRMRRMTDARWLENYQYYEDLQRTFNFIKKRSKFPSNLDQATEHLMPLEESLGLIFLDFFPLLIDYCRKQIKTKYSNI